AVAYVQWLSSSGRVPGARLCTEYEWERAARGADDRDYPHGDVLDPEDANFTDTYDKDPLAAGPDEVGSHPATRSVFGVDDMGGNAFEWVTSSVTLDKSAARGGAYTYDAITGLIPNRQTPQPQYRDGTLGLRVCADYPLPPAR